MRRLDIESDDRGFTLIEVLIASLLLAIILTGIGFFFMNIIKQSDVLDDRTRGMELARQGLEEIRTLDITSMPLGRTIPEDIDYFHRCFEISEVDPLYPSARNVRCVVYWLGAVGSDSISFSSIF
ncbi:MAG: prepilin-type N-terminal cleavage/methylation domain-containing protein [Candidatus Aegiribacteria sp.]|nr:prepilin-type N-terminal cleavage/methylation domain-containing protein [Candidatus Aegiribacteria sp.]